MAAFEDKTVRAEPCGQIGREFRLGFLAVTSEQIVPIAANGRAETGVAPERGIFLPAPRQQAKPTNGKRLHQGFLEPLRRGTRLRGRFPAIAQDVAKFMAELIGELAPVVRADVDDDPRCAGVVVVHQMAGRPSV